MKTNNILPTFYAKFNIVYERLYVDIRIVIYGMAYVDIFREKAMGLHRKRRRKKR